MAAYSDLEKIISNQIFAFINRKLIIKKCKFFFKFPKVFEKYAVIHNEKDYCI